MIYVLVVSHESLGVVAFALCAAFERDMESTFAEIEIVGVAH